MTRDELLNTVAQKAETEEGALALLLSGSLGKGDGDAWSDIDLILVMDPEKQPAFVEQVESWVRALTPLCHWMNTVPGLPIFSAITEDWQRLDITVTVPGLIMGTQDGVTALFDRANIVESLEPAPPPRAPGAGKLMGLTLEFIRVLGLLPVVLGRQDYLVGVTGVGLQRTALIDLILETMALPAPPGALKLAALLSPEDRKILGGLPPISADRAAIITANQAIAAAFLPRAQAALGDAFPQDFLNATLAHLEHALGEEWPQELL